MAPREETCNYYGDAARQVEIISLGCHGEFIMVLCRDVPRDGVCINGRFAYTTKQKPLGAWHAKTEAYVGEHRMLDERFT